MVMKKFVNNPDNITTELLQGYTLAYSDKVKLVSDRIVVRANPKPKNKVALVTLGGSGHEPSLSGFVGEGLLDASVVGDIFAAPGAPRVLEALRMFKDYAGIVLVILNHAGDVLNGDMAYNMAVKEGINVKKILTAEDIAAGIDAPLDERRGLGGCVPLYKIAGAAAEEGKSLDQVLAVAEKFSNSMATLAVTMKTATHPQSGQYISELADDEMMIGMGQHGEGGAKGPQKILTADQTAEEMVNRLIPAAKLQKNDKALLIINGSGATTLMEMFIVFRKAHQILTNAGINVVSGRCEEILTVQEAAGFQMFLAKLDDETQKYLNAPSNAPYWITK
ncbi:MAG: dihydroxyacetone kinase subunit DhaK [Planctomycetaceae bacterium]|jgi:dihydroxyacetone kinase-like protein|nr:dihydroxyacetone kinase subunit DhaK [Planctomycetaceae bacterium]